MLSASSRSPLLSSLLRKSTIRRHLFQDQKRLLLSSSTKSTKSSSDSKRPKATSATTLDDEIEKLIQQGKKRLPRASRTSLNSAIDNSAIERRRIQNLHKENKAISISATLQAEANASSLFASLAKKNADNNDIVDIFSIPDPPSSHPKESAEDTITMEQYLEMLNPIVESDRWQKKHTSKPVSPEKVKTVVDWLQNPDTVADYKTNLSTFQRMIQQHGKSDTASSPQPLDIQALKELFKKETQQQQESFRKKLSMSKVQMELAEAALHQASNMCAKNARGRPVPLIWQKVKEMGCANQPLLQNLLYVSATFTTTAANTTRRRKRRSQYGRLTGMTSILDILEENNENLMLLDENDDGDDFVDITDEIAIYHDLLYEPTEQTISIRIRLLVSQGKAQEAEALLLENERQEKSETTKKRKSKEGKAELRLRAYTPVLRLHLEQGNLGAALNLYKRMRTMPLVLFDVETYVHILSGIAERGAFKNNAKPIKGAKELGYSPPSGPGLFDQLVTDMASEIIDIPEAFTKRLYNALAKGDDSSTLQVTRSLAPLRIVDEPAASDELVASRVHIDPCHGECPRTGVQLRLIRLEQNDIEKLKQGVVGLSKSEQMNHKKKVKNKSLSRNTIVQSADQHLLQFYDWMDTRKGEPFTAIIDGANVGYYMQNFEDGGFSYHQVKFVLDTLERMGETPMVILPNKYTRDSFYNSIGVGTQGQAKRQYLTAEEKRIRNELHQTGKLFTVPPGFLDDYYWILASVSAQTVSRNGRDLSVSTEDPKGRWPGARPILITNDQMRDHKVEMLEPMLFRRWCSNFIVNYNFAAFVDGECAHPEIGFQAADFFSREIQGNLDKTGSTVWHFPIQEKENEWFCIRIPHS